MSNGVISKYKYFFYTKKGAQTGPFYIYKKFNSPRLSPTPKSLFLRHPLFWIVGENPNLSGLNALLPTFKKQLFTRYVGKGRLISKISAYHFFVFVFFMPRRYWQKPVKSKEIFPKLF